MENPHMWGTKQPTSTPKRKKSKKQKSSEEHLIKSLNIHKIPQQKILDKISLKIPKPSQEHHHHHLHLGLLATHGATTSDALLAEVAGDEGWVKDSSSSWYNKLNGIQLDLTMLYYNGLIIYLI